MFFVSIGLASSVLRTHSGLCGTAHVSQNLPTISNAHKIVSHDNDEVGDTITFFVRDDVFANPANFVEVEFIMKHDDEKLSIYVESDVWMNDMVDDNGIIAIAEIFLNSTPAEERGALEIEEEYFGNLPDVDTNEKLFVLIMDINDDSSSSKSSEIEIFKNSPTKKSKFIEVNVNINI